MAAIGFHFHANAVSRSAGRSSVKSAAYITREKLHDERLDKTFDFSRKAGVEYVRHAAPKDAPEWAQDIGQAWNKVEEVENRKNSTQAREFVAAFPHQIDAQQRKFILDDFMREELTRKHFLATAGIHAPDREGDERNYHAHIMFSERPLDADGFAKNKDRRFTSFETREEALESVKIKWAELGARQLEKAGFEVEAERWRHGYKTLPVQAELAKARGDFAYVEDCDREATKHIGVAAVAMERKGEPTERGELHRETEARNEQRQQIKEELASLDRQEAVLNIEPERVASRSFEDFAQRQTERNANPTRDYSPLHATHAQVAEQLKQEQERCATASPEPEPPAQEYPKRGEIIQDEPIRSRAEQTTAPELEAGADLRRKREEKTEKEEIGFNPEVLAEIRRRMEAEEERERERTRER